MVNSSDTIHYTKLGFNNETYKRLQKQAIEERMQNFSGRLYLEIGGKFLWDPHASRVLPGFTPDTKKEIFASFQDQAEILFCVNGEDIVRNRQLSNEDVDYQTYVLRMIKRIEDEVGIVPHVVLNMVDPYELSEEVVAFERNLQRQNYKVWERYFIDGYPEDIETILSEDGFGQDDHIPLTKNLVLVTGAASSSGKMSTCLGQIYLDHQIDIKSGYAKFETFPIWNLPLDHPINLAYEAATADIGDYNMMDTYHQDTYGVDSVNYNRDVEAFEIVSHIGKEIVNHKNYMVKYKSPTDMGINRAGFAIDDDEICSIASYQEINRRKQRYQQMVDRGEGEEQRVEKCDELLRQAKAYCDEKGYHIDRDLE